MGMGTPKGWGGDSVGMGTAWGHLHPDMVTHGGMVTHRDSTLTHTHTLPLCSLLTHHRHSTSTQTQPNTAVAVLTLSSHSAHTQLTLTACLHARRRTHNAHSSHSTHNPRSHPTVTHTPRATYAHTQPTLTPNAHTQGHPLALPRRVLGFISATVELALGETAVRSGEGTHLGVLGVGVGGPSPMGGGRGAGVGPP